MESHISKFGVYNAVVIFNDGNAGILEDVGGKIAMLKELNKDRVDKAELRA